MRVEVSPLIQVRPCGDVYGQFFFPARNSAATCRLCTNRVDEPNGLCVACSDLRSELHSNDSEVTS